MTVEEKAYNYASKLVKNRLTANEVAAHYGRGYIDSQADMKQQGWHPADEDEPEPYETVVVYCETSSGITSAKEACVNENHCWSEPNVKWWCYPPKEE